ncbi:hypothetical protein PRIPAC_74832 [Pristionchus pacificus]|uniref:Uncharacterized protein n=1 Tax=Pristionchus pacificus TaxID=54126 RepID=A0A2A6C7J4_PRIPA|nr:hypothetical protein PRIPAC_74832 [Pristionchus pacificus]|eukprot:PDM74129.1 hypothetical protein PRIPAC_41485 [Pristionchus pacificus]
MRTRRNCSLIGPTEPDRPTILDCPSPTRPLTLNIEYPSRSIIPCSLLVECRSELEIHQLHIFHRQFLFLEESSFLAGCWG